MDSSQSLLFVSGVAVDYIYRRVVIVGCVRIEGFS